MRQKYQEGLREGTSFLENSEPRLSQKPHLTLH